MKQLIICFFLFIVGCSNKVYPNTIYDKRSGWGVNKFGYYENYHLKKDYFKKNRCSPPVDH